jgi:lysophospholipase L1-like esterase
VQFFNLGSFTVNFTVTDSLGLADPTPASDVISVSGDTLAYPSWTLKFVDSQELDGQGVKGFDGDTGTMWHTQWRNGSPPPPHEIQIKLGGPATLNGFVYVPRQDGSPNGRIGQYEFYVSTDGVNWGSPVATGTFANSATAKQVSFASKTGQYVRLRALSEVNGNPFISMAELYVLGSCTAPVVKLATPRSLNLQTSTTLNVLANACLDSTQNGWGVRFVLDGGPSQGGAQVDTHTPPFQVNFANLSRAEHIVDAFIIDTAGNQVAGTATHDQANPVGIGDYFVAMGDSITFGFGDTVSSDDISLDGRNAGGGYAPVLNNLRTAAKHYPQTVVNEAVGGTKSIDGVSIIPILLSRNPGAQYFLIEYGTNDAVTPVPSGSGLHPGDAGYPGSFKDNMQQIITAVKNAGKLPYLGKVPYSIGQYLARNTLYQTYNQVIDQLVAENNITVIPPDFYTWFQNHQNQFSDDLHPNGIGYQSMANLWQSALP